jgi:PKD repeat protein
VVVTTPLRGSDEFNRHELGVEFIEPRQSVSVTVHHYRFHELPSYWPEAVGEFLGFDAAGRVIARDRVAFGPSEGWQRLSVEDPDDRIVGVELWFDRGSAQENWFVADDLRAETAGSPPTATFDYSPSDPWPGETVAFDASASNDRDGRIVSYEWRIASRDPPLLVAFDGDDSPTFDYTFEAAGEYEVRLTVADDDEARNTTTRTVVVRENAPPAAAFEFAPAAPVAGQRVDLDGSTSFDPDGVVGSYRWAVDGEFVGEGDTPRYWYEFPEPGEYVVTLTVTDDRRATDRTTERVVVSEPS